MEPVTPSKRKGAPEEGADEPTAVVRAVGDDTGMIQSDYELVPGTQLGDYQLEHSLGGGGMGDVFAAVHPKIGKRAAIKVLKKELSDQLNVQRFVDEAKIVNTIGHPNIVDIFAFGEMPDGRCYFVMELLIGETLRSRIAREPLPPDEIFAILRPLCRALEAAHAKGVIHRDLKPDNIFLVEVAGEQPIVKLLDFGIAKLAKADHRIEQTKSGVMIGTPQYIAPEQAKGREIDARADIYALGGITFEMLTGKPPFEADNAMEMVAKHLMEEPRRPSTIAPRGKVSPELDSLVVAMLAKDPAQRPSLADVATIIDRIKAGPIQVDDRETTPAPRPPRVPAPLPRAPTPLPPVLPRPPTVQPEPAGATATYAGEPVSGAHTTVEAVPALPTLDAMPVEHTDLDAVEIGRGRGPWIAALFVLFGIGMLLSFVLIRSLRGGGDSTDPERTALVEPDASSPTAPPILEPDAGPAIAPADAPLAGPDAASTPPVDPRRDAGVDRPIQRPIERPIQRPIERPRPRPHLVLDVRNAGATLQIFANGRRVGSARHLDLDLVLNQSVALEIRSEGRSTKRLTVRATPRTPVVTVAVDLELDLAEPK